MKVIIGKPPIWDEAHRLFDIDDSITFYTYGDAVYAPSGAELTDELIVHENVHRMQQEAIGGPEKWWREYFDDIHFRLREEAEAYAAQYLFFCSKTGDRNMRYRYLSMVSGFLASPLYRIGLGHGDAMSHIDHYAHSPTPPMGLPRQRG